MATNSTRPTHSTQNPRIKLLVSEGGRRSISTVLIVFLPVFLGMAACAAESGRSQPPQRPNILWLSCEDMSAHAGCYGDPLATTPNVDRLAEEGVRYTHAFTTAGVCAPCRSAIITGMYQTSLGTQHMRCEATLPDHVKPFTTWLREAGYYCTNNSKTDYQFKAPADTWDVSSGSAHWKNRPSDDTPFFAVFNYTGCHESGIAVDSKYESVTAGLVRHDRNRTARTIPPYYPDTPVVREDWGRYYDVVEAMDRWVGERLKELDDAGLRESTIVMYWTDHGVGLPRCKRWVYDSGTRVPLIVRVPEALRTGSLATATPGRITDRLVSLIDLGPTVLNLAGVSVPSHMQGQAFLGEHIPPARQHVFAARDRMDERYDIIRTVRDRQYRYVRNYQPDVSWYQYINTAEKGRTMQEIRRVFEDGSAAESVARYFAPTKPVEELYDTHSDPHEMHNLVESASPAHQQALQELRARHLAWVRDTRDLGLIPEAELHRLKKGGSEWAILNTASDADDRMKVISETAAMAVHADAENLAVLDNRLTDSDSVVRYWACIGIGNKAVHRQQDTGLIRQLQTRAQSDESENVRVAAALALAKLGQPELALGPLTEVLDNGTQWARLHAAVVIDQLDDDARPALEAMKRNRAYREEFVAKGKYVVRVLNRAINELEGTREVVD